MMPDEKKRLGLTAAEFDNLMQAVRYGIIIVIAVLITFTVVASVSLWFGYVPPSPSGLDPTPTSSTSLP